MKRDGKGRSGNPNGDARGFTGKRRYNDRTQWVEGEARKPEKEREKDNGPCCRTTEGGAKARRGGSSEGGEIYVF